MRRGEMIRRSPTCRVYECLQKIDCDCGGTEAEECVAEVDYDGVPYADEGFFCTQCGCEYIGDFTDEQDEDTEE